MSLFEPKRADFAQAVSDLHKNAPLSCELGVTLDTIEPGFVSALMPCKRAVTQQHGFVHAGAIATLADIVCGLAAYTLIEADASVLSVNINLSLMRPAGGDYLRGEGRVIIAGRRIYFTEAEIIAVSKSGEKLVAKATATMTSARSHKPTTK